MSAHIYLFRVFGVWFSHFCWPQSGTDGTYLILWSFGRQVDGKFVRNVGGDLEESVQNFEQNLAWPLRARFAHLLRFLSRFSQQFWRPPQATFFDAFFSIFGAGTLRHAKHRKKCQVLRPSQPPIPPKFHQISAKTEIQKSTILENHRELRLHRSL